MKKKKRREQTTEQEERRWKCVYKLRGERKELESCSFRQQTDEGKRERERERERLEK
jgi:hypothetical protein